MENKKVEEHETCLNLDKLRHKIRQHTHADEAASVNDLLACVKVTKEVQQRVRSSAYQLVQQCRTAYKQRGLLDAFLQEFGLSNQEGIALMCIAEALLRIPDADTANKLINEKILSAQWRQHLGNSDSWLVNASTLSLMLTGQIVSLGKDISHNPIAWLGRLTAKSGESVIRAAMMQAMRIMGQQYILGHTVDAALKRGLKENILGTRFSFDMLGEGARTLPDAQRYFDTYLNAIHVIGEQSDADNIYAANGISIKLSALHPRYQYSHIETVMEELLPRVQQLAITAKKYHMGLTIDAEESERLDISLDIFAALVTDPQLKNWDGLGIVVQAYQKRAPYLIDWLIQLGRETHKKLMVRLVKGAYWDREIKFAQEMGFQDYPVYTRKCATDLSYQVCAQRLFDAQDVIFPQFATHNAHSIAFILEIAQNKSFEFQRLQGMGDLLYGELLDYLPNKTSVRVYAPVGEHKDLLPYLVRRLLENGANSSFVNQFMNLDVPILELIQDPLVQIEQSQSVRHPEVPAPPDLYRQSNRDGSHRQNSFGWDLDNPDAVERLYKSIYQVVNSTWSVASIVNGVVNTDTSAIALFNPAAKQQCIGTCYHADHQQIETALESAYQAYAEWDALAGNARAKILHTMADLLQDDQAFFIGLIAQQAGRTLQDGVSELREAVDFCRYYAIKAEQYFESPVLLPGPAGEDNELSLHGRGVFFCISPWNFPLAIFVGQIAAALAAGNCVIAKPAENTSVIASEAVKRFHQAGVPAQVLQLLLGKGRLIGEKLVSDQRIAGVAFTGSTSVASLINQQLSQRPGAITPLIAETGGQNVMIVDASALAEQVVDDVISSAFSSAGQRCSALRVLYLQDDVADHIINMLTDALDALVLGDPIQLSTDIGPVIDAAALQTLTQHLQQISACAKIVKQYPTNKIPEGGYFFGPTIIAIDSIKQLKEEVFGPILHVVRYRSSELENVIQDINATGYGLTLGVHSRIDEFAEYIFNHTHVGNTYVNRNMIGAVVGVQPFGGQGLSGTGPKAGGPYYLLRFATEKTKTVNTAATGGNVDLYRISY